MSALPSSLKPETTLLGTVGVLSVTIVLILAALVLRNWFGPLGGR